jgi:hypothetical protein
MHFKKENNSPAARRKYYSGTYQEILAKNKPAKNFFVFDILPPVKIEKVAKEILGLKEYKSPQAKTIALGWRSALAALFIIFILTGLTPFGLIRMAFSAFGSRTIKLNYYSENCFVDQGTGGYKNGWWNTGKIIGEPNNSTDSQFDKFSDENSGFYNGGLSSAYCAGFKPAMKDKNIDEAISDTPAADSTGNVDILPDDNSDQSVQVLENNNDKSAVEVIDNAVSKIFQPIAVKSKNLFGSLSAWAQESDQEKLKKIGDLKSVKINFSLAINEKANREIKKLDERSSTTPEDNIGSSSTVVIPEQVEINRNFSSTTDEFQNASDTPMIENDNSVEILDNDNQSEVKVDEAPATDTKVLIEPETGEEQKAEPQDTEIATTSFLDMKTFWQVMDAHAEEASTTGSEASTSQPIITVWYSVEADVGTAGTSTYDFWHELDTFNLPTSNSLLNKYFSYDAPFIKSQTDLGNLKIKMEGRIDGESTYITYVDSVWAEAAYEKKQKDQPDELALKMERWKKMLKMISFKKDFEMNELPIFKFQYEKKSRSLLRLIQESLNMADYWGNVGLHISIAYQDGTKANLPYSLVQGEGGEFEIRITQMPKDLKPGQYRILFSFDDSSDGQKEEIALDQEFSWGVLAVNFSKTIYRPAETAYLQMAALDNNGHTLCNADLSLEITAPDGGVAYLNNQNGLIVNNPECGSDNVISTPDYYSYYNLAGIGIYKVKLSYSSPYGTKEISDQFEVRDDSPFEIERVGPTRIYPSAEYGMKIVVKANEDFSGDITESIPEGFKVLNNELRIMNNEGKETIIHDSKFIIQENVENKKLAWKDIKVEKGEKVEINYSFDAPDVSPAFYLLGPLKVGDFAEARKWQIASDALETRANSVQFFGGRFNATGLVASGASSDASNTLPTFNFKLAENGVTVKSAYIILEAQFEAYANNAGNYLRHRIAFDSCAAPCAPNAFTGSGNVIKYDNTVIAFDSTESNMVKLLLDVTQEAQMASYGGNSALMSGQVGYRFDRNTAIGSIANAKATLVVTYTYNPNTTTSYSNTVTYPLESLDSARVGTKATSTADDCTLNSTCPLFGYNMTLPDFTTASSSKISQWFKYDGISYANGANDVSVMANIQGNDTPSYLYIHESALNGQTAMPSIFFDQVLGYNENTNQLLEVRATTTTANPPHYLQGGEVTETYFASSSFATKTRTVSFPIGVVNDGLTTATTSASVDVFFPENGAATGTVKIKKVWLRIISNESNSVAAHITQVCTKTDSNATSSISNYNYRQDVTVVKPSFNIYHIIPATDYAQLENANAVASKTIKFFVHNDTILQGGTSAELMVTYTYDNENYGHLTTLNLYAGQSSVVASTTSTTTATANLVIAESKGTKTIRGGALLASYLASAGNLTMPTNGTTTIDANIAVNSPVCTNSHNVLIDTQNNFFEFYKNVAPSLSPIDNQSYYACYSNNTAANATVGAKMNGILIYTYQWDNKAPTSTFLSTKQNVNGSRLADVSFQAWDQDTQDLKARLDYVSGAACNFSTPLDPTISTVVASTTASQGQPKIDNGLTYQVGTTSSWILTGSGSNNVNTVWEAGTDLNNVEGTYCLRLTTNDLYLDQATSATSTIYIDTKNPTNPGAMSLNSRTGTKIVLNYGATSTETNFKEYKIFYKQYDGTPVYDTDAGVSVVSSSTDGNLGDQYFKNIATTSISGLTAMQTYSIRIYAYDNYGNKASSSQVDIIANDAPIGFFNPDPLTLQKTDGSGKVTVSFEADDLNNSNTCRAKIEYVPGADCNFSSPQIPALDAASIQAEYGSTWIDTNQPYQIGTSTPTDHWIWTAPGQDTVSFDWLTKSALPAANGDYCLRLTMNDNYDDQLVLATTSVLVDNVNPIAGASLTEGPKTQTSITLMFGLPATDDHFDHYKIFYKQGTSGVTENDSEKVDGNLSDRLFFGVSSTTVYGLTHDQDYVFNIWAYDKGGNKAAATEVTIRTNSSLTNQSLDFIDPASANIAVGNGTSTFTFRAVVNETTGWENIASTTLRLGDSSDNTAPYSDLVFKWDQNTNVFSETGADALGAVALSNTSSSTCSGITCTLDFKLIFNNGYHNSSTNYPAELYSENDLGRSDLDSTADIYQVRTVKVKQIHYRWRYDNGKE